MKIYALSNEIAHVLTESELREQERWTNLTRAERHAIVVEATKARTRIESLKNRGKWATTDAAIRKELTRKAKIRGAKGLTATQTAIGLQVARGKRDAKTYTFTDEGGSVTAALVGTGQQVRGKQIRYYAAI